MNLKTTQGALQRHFLLSGPAGFLACDPGTALVWDEFTGQWIALLPLLSCPHRLSGFTPCLNMMAGFVLFPPVRHLENMACRLV